MQAKTFSRKKVANLFFAEVKHMEDKEREAAGEPEVGARGGNTEKVRMMIRNATQMSRPWTRVHVSHKKGGAI